MPTVTYKWTTKTSGRSALAGTDADVYLALSGTRGAMQDYVALDDPNAVNDFEKGDVNSGTFTYEDLGDLRSGFLLENKGRPGSDWAVDYITVMNLGDGRTWRCDLGGAFAEEEGRNGTFPLEFYLANQGRNVPTNGHGQTTTSGSVSPEQYEYNRGYGDARQTPDTARAYIQEHVLEDNPFHSPDYWYQQGVYDGLTGKASRTLAAADLALTRSQGSGGQTYVDPPRPGSGGGGAPVSGNGQIYTRPAPPYQGPRTGNIPVYAPNAQPWQPTWPQWQPRSVRYLELCAMLFGKPVNYDTVVQISRIEGGPIVDLAISFGVSFELLGDDPGEQRRGFRLSGPTGRIARAVQQALATRRLEYPDPRFYGLSDWVMAKTSTGLKFIGLSELERLGLLPNP